MQRLATHTGSFNAWLRGFGNRIERSSPGQGLVEYSLLLLLIVLVCIGIVTILGQTVSGVWYDRIINSWPTS
ncbi:MAG TPA: hypothetical protein PKA05_04890 [Roseiflexaceae bacterium]|nr:hypothetical protein [Roseiflexaceae bacterium]HMP39698.1 hypothetical protein [Roseiflexaceae bacterium]